MNSKGIVLAALLAISIGGTATLLLLDSTPSETVTSQPPDDAQSSTPGTFSNSPPEQADSRTASIPPPMREFDGFSTRVIIGAIRHYARSFEFSNIYCVVEVGEDACTLTMTWKLPDEYRPGQLLVYTNADELIASGWSGSVPVDLTPGENTFLISYLNEKGENYLVSTTESFAANASADILGPDRCEMTSPADDTCRMDIQLVGFATRVILYDLDNQATLFELDPDGLFKTTYWLDVPPEGIRLGLFSNEVSNDNLLARKSIMLQPVDQVP